METALSTPFHTNVGHLLPVSPNKRDSLDLPAGLKAIIEKLHSVYPEQPNPLQVTTVLKFWLGGQDPLDYISMFSNRGDLSRNIPPHWHYVSFGLSDLHGDGRVHDLKSGDLQRSSRSGMGFELTFRLLKNTDEIRAEIDHPKERLQPPTWPANLMQSLARYSFRTGNKLCFGDNIPCRNSLGDRFDIPLQNIIIAEDPQLGSLVSPFGSVNFCQIVGATLEEVEQAARWNGQGVLDYMRQDMKTGGEWLVTRLGRKKSIFDLNPEHLVNLQEVLDKQGSDLAGINAEFSFREISKRRTRKSSLGTTRQGEENSVEMLASRSSKENKNLITPVGLEDARSLFNSMTLISHKKKEAKIQKTPIELVTNDDQPAIQDFVTLDGIEISIDPCAAKYLLLAVKDRIRHGRHFTFKAHNFALTFLSENVNGAGVTKTCPYGVLGYWIQVLIPDDLVPRMIRDFQVANVDRMSQLGQWAQFVWPDKGLKIIVGHPQEHII